MKNLALIAAATVVMAAAIPAHSQAYTEPFGLEELNISFGDMQIALPTRVDVWTYVTPMMTEYTCRQRLARPDPVEFLVPALPGTFDPGQGFPRRVAFLPLETIDGRWALWPRSEVAIGLVGYTWSQTRPDWPPGFASDLDMTGGKDSFLIGFRVAHSDGNHHGWLRMTRPAVTVTNFFKFDSYAIHPVPGEPIRAGVEPPVPVLTAHPGDPAQGTAFVLRWPAGYSDNAGYQLETAVDLTPPTEWELVPSYPGEYPVPVGTEDRFFRLKSP